MFPHLNSRMEKGNRVQHGFPLRKVADVQLVLIYTYILHHAQKNIFKYMV